MKLWILRPRRDLEEGNDPWKPWYDKSFGFIIRAETETQARVIADSNGADENRGEFLRQKIADTKNPWLSAMYSTCEILSSEGNEELIMHDFAAA